MKLYLAGPMRGYENLNFPAFHAAAEKLREQGHSVFCPAENDIGEDLRRAFAMDTQWICLCADGIALLPGWEESKGATAEHALATALGLKVILLEDD